MIKRVLPIMAAALGGMGLVVGCVPQPHAHVAAPRAGSMRVALLPLANYTTSRDAPDQLAAILGVELARQWNARVIDRGVIDAALSMEPWLLMDRLPPDLVDRLGQELDAEVLLIGSVLGYGYRDADGEKIPHVSLSLRLLETPGGRVRWSAVHSRDGADGAVVFGIGLVSNVEQLAEQTVREIIATFPARATTGTKRSVAASTSTKDRIAP